MTQPRPVLIGPPSGGPVSSRVNSRINISVPVNPSSNCSGSVIVRKKNYQQSISRNTDIIRQTRAFKQHCGGEYLPTRHSLASHHWSDHSASSHQVHLENSDFASADTTEPGLGRLGTRGLNSKMSFGVGPTTQPSQLPPFG